MGRKPPATPQEMWDLVVRRKWWIVVPAVIVPVLVFVVSLHLPKQYESDTVVLVDPQKIPTEYVKSAVASDITDRLQTIKEEVMSRTRLQRIADEMGLYQDLRKSHGMDEVINTMQKDITVEIIKGSNDRNPIDGFKIGYTAPTPQMAQAVAAKIAALFIQENLKVTDQEAQGTNNFIVDELQKSKAQLDEKEEQIRAFKASHLGSLPEQEASNLSLISQYQSMAQANSEAIDRANQQKVYLQSLLNMDGGDKSILSRPVSPAQVELQERRKELQAARQKYTDQHPDVIRLEGEVAALEQQVKQGDKGKNQPIISAGLTVGQQLQGQLVAVQQEIRSRTLRQAQLEAQIRGLQARVETLPSVQSEFADLSRDYNEMQKNYDSLLEKQQSSGMAAELSKHNDSEDFRILDPASLPNSPSAPNLLMINGAGVLAGIVLGLALAVGMDFKDSTIHNPEDLERYLDLPLIVALPSIAQEFHGKMPPHKHSSRVTA